MHFIGYWTLCIDFHLFLVLESKLGKSQYFVWRGKDGFAQLNGEHALLWGWVWWRWFTICSSHQSERIKITKIISTLQLWSLTLRIHGAEWWDECGEERCESWSEWRERKQLQLGGLLRPVSDQTSSSESRHQTPGHTRTQQPSLLLPQLSPQWEVN